MARKIKTRDQEPRLEERRNEVVGCSARILAAVFYFVDREEGGLYTPVVKSYLHLGGRLINYRLYRSLDVPRDCSGLIADLTVIPCMCVCVTVLLVPLGNDWTRARVDPV